MVVVKLYIMLILLMAQGCGTTRAINNRNKPETDQPREVNSKPYTDPDGAFTINIPEGWKVERNKDEGRWVSLVSIDKHAWATLISSDKYEAARLLILSFRQPPMDSYTVDLKARMLAEIGKPIFEG